MTLFFSLFFLAINIFDKNALCEETDLIPKVVPKVLLVDKKTNVLHLSEYLHSGYNIVKTYHTTLGQVKGDKTQKNDLKTPEGIYLFEAELRPPSIAAKFGKMAFNMNFPNPYDKIAGSTGSGIMLHATNEPERLKKDYDSEGCVVVKNEEIEELKSHIRLGLTPILIFSEISPEFMMPNKNIRLQQVFQNWIASWESKNIEKYIEFYHSEFSSQGRNKQQWNQYKQSLNSRYQNITIRPENVFFYSHPKYSMITFTQNYESKMKNHAIGHKSTGTKILYIAEEDNEPKIISESFQRVKW